jgi:hypothetical protein
MSRRFGPSKYTPLTDYLAALTVDQVTLSFPEIEALVGGALPATAWRQGFWSNGGRGLFRRPPWVQAGWRVARLDQHRETPMVTFVRIALAPRRLAGS